jgi:hypothetical protein
LGCKEFYAGIDGRVGEEGLKKRRFKSLFGFFSSSKPIFYEPGVIKIKLFISINALIFIYPEP